MNYKASFIFLMSFIFITAGYCQYQNIQVPSSYGPNEVSIMINPKNPNQMAIGSNIYYSGSDTSLSGFYYSTNSGFNWVSGVLHSTAARPSGDPVILADTNGAFYFLQNANYAIQPWWNTELIMKSTDGGRTWANGELIGKDNATVQDKPWGCVDFTHGPYGNSIYVTWSRFSAYLNPAPSDSSYIMFSRSKNSGRLPWSAPVRISKLTGDAYDSSNTVEGAVPCVGPDGDVFVCWSGPKIRNQQYGIFFDRSTDGGVTWLDEDIFAAEQPGGWAISIPYLFRCNGMPVSACDNSSGPHRGNVYINFSDQRNGAGDCDIWFIKSTDKGNNWSPAKRVNNDPPGRNQFYTWMSIDQVTGYIYIVFYDQRNTSIFYTDVYLARSTDGGETFQNVRINTNPVSVSQALYDYIGISAYNGKVRPVWMGSFYSIYTAIVDSFVIGIQNISNTVPGKFNLYQNYPNPFNPSTKIRFDVALDSRLRGNDNVMLKIYDIMGREIAILINEQLQPGTYEIEWDGSKIASGVYYYTLSAGDPSAPLRITKKMILIK